MEDHSSGLQNAVAQLVRVIGNYAESNNKLSKRILFQSIVLTVATVVMAIATVLIAITQPQ